MTKEELIAKLKEAKDLDFDPEIAHVKADQAILDFINDEEINKIYDDISKWYS